ncbi:MAG TPA: bifunctional methylenetetrahydrofolate dehydrogenase/methenyltetrahydrofolate cyclohydrolase FolD [Spirochaetia bacterium]|nr:bifunctional methylenetetrahydrofolate dehydrogenase/methenyltetrahydrofolate cyclohydrolase FolD [Spirochaetia bacterium]
MAIIIDGNALSKKIKDNLRVETDALFDKTNKRPCLAVVLVGENPASHIYVASKEKACHHSGILSKSYKVENMKETELEELILKLNQDPEINGILVQLPLPEGLNEEKIIDLIDPIKDVDGFHPYNTGKLWINLKPYFFPCTPWGIYELIKEYKIDLSGKEVVVLGRSNIVGKPIAGILLQKFPYADATVTVCHSRTKNLEEHLKRADVIVAAIGKPEFVKEEWVKQGAVIIDVGINRVADEASPKGYRVTGDVDFQTVEKKASYITPVPGGVGAMTIAVLLQNTVKAFKIQNGMKD